MTWIENIQNKPRGAKIRIMWAVAIVVVALLIVVWAISAHFHKNAPADTSIFQTIGSGIHQVRENYGK